MPPSETTPLAFTPASELQYECTIHTMQVEGDDGQEYRVVLDLIRSDENPQWNVLYDHLALRAAVIDARGQVIASIFKEAARDDFATKVGRMEIMNAQGRIAFVSNRDSSGKMIDGQLDFELHVDLFKSGKVQSFADEIKSVIKKFAQGAHSHPEKNERNQSLPLQLLVTDYPYTRHTGTITVKRAGIEKPLLLRADKTRSTMSHHYGNSLTPYVFLASVPKEDAPNFIAVITREALNLFEKKLFPQVVFPVGYLLRTNADGATSFSLLRANANHTEKPGELNLGTDFLGIGLEVRIHQEVGSICLNDDQLPARTAFGRVTIYDHPLGSALVQSEGTLFADVVIDVTGNFLDETGWGSVAYGT